MRLSFYPLARSARRERVWDALDRWALDLDATTPTEHTTAAIVFLTSLMTWRSTWKGPALEASWLLASWLAEGLTWALQALPLPIRCGVIGTAKQVWRVRWLGWIVDWNDALAWDCPVVVMPPAPAGAFLTPEQIAELTPKRDTYQ